MSLEQKISMKKILLDGQGVRVENARKLVHADGMGFAIVIEDGVRVDKSDDTYPLLMVEVRNGVVLRVLGGLESRWSS